MTKNPETIVYRVAQGDTPWVAYQATSFSERFDDPKREFFVLYACSDRVGCFVEGLAHFRVGDLPGWHKLFRFDPDSSIPPGQVPLAWLLKRSSQSARLLGSFADIAHSRWIAAFNSYRWWMDQSSIYSKVRAKTQWMARLVYDDAKGYAGIFYGSRHGRDFENWAVFEDRLEVSEYGLVEPLSETDSDFLEACLLLHLQPPSPNITEEARSRKGTGL